MMQKVVPASKTATPEITQQALEPVDEPGISSFLTNDERDPGMGIERRISMVGHSDWAESEGVVTRRDRIVHPMGSSGFTTQHLGPGLDPTRTRGMLSRTQSKFLMDKNKRAQRMKLKKQSSKRQNVIGSLLAVVEEYGIRRRKTDFHAQSQFPVLLPTGNFRKRWDLFCLVVLLYVCTVTPFSIAFIGDDLQKFPGWEILFFLDRFVDLVFMVDIVFNFRTAWMDVEGHMCFEWKECAVNYMKGWLFIDVVSVIPYDLITVEDPDGSGGGGVGQRESALNLLKVLRILRIAKVMRVLRAARILKRMEQQMSIKFGVVKLVKFFVLIIMASHWMACAYYLAGSLADPSVEHESWIHSHDYPSEYTIGDMYVVSMYWAVMTITTIGYGDVPSGTTTERLLSIIAMIIGAGLFSYVVGTMTSLIQGLDISTRAFEDKMDSINEYMSLSNFPLHLRRRIRADCFYQRDTRSFLPSERDLYASVSPALRSMCAYYKYQGLLKRVPYFAHAPTQVISELALLLKHAIYMPGECVMKAGEVGHVMYFMYKGRAHLEMIGRDNDPIILGLLTDGTHFGERGMLFSARRLHTVRCLSYCDTCIINGDDYARLMRFHPDVKAEVRRMVVRKMWMHLSKSGKLREAFEKAKRVPMRKEASLDLSVMQTKIDELQALLLKQMRYRDLELKAQQEKLLTAKREAAVEAAKEHEQEKTKLRRKSMQLEISLKEMQQLHKTGTLSPAVRANGPTSFDFNAAGADADADAGKGADAAPADKHDENVVLSRGDSVASLKQANDTYAGGGINSEAMAENGHRPPTLAQTVDGEGIDGRSLS